MKPSSMFFAIAISLSIAACSSKKRSLQKRQNITSDAISQTYNTVYSERNRKAPSSRFTEVSFSLESDTLWVDIAMSTSRAEGPLSGELWINLDEYELAYASEPFTNIYEETLSIEGESRGGFNPAFMLLGGLGRGSLVRVPRQTNRSSRRSQEQVVKENLHWNVVSVFIDKEDYLLFSASSDLYYKVRTKHDELYIYPSRTQIKDVRRYMRKYTKAKS